MRRAIVALAFCAACGTLQGADDGTSDSGASPPAPPATDGGEIEGGAADASEEAEAGSHVTCPQKECTGSQVCCIMPGSAPSSACEDESACSKGSVLRCTKPGDA